MTTWSLTAVSLQGGERAKWVDMLADLLLKYTGEDGATPFRLEWVESLIADWIANPGAA